MDTLTQQRPGVLSSAAAPPASAPYESAVSAVSWPAIFAGAFAATATSLVLAALGSGFGMASVSAWPNSGVSGTTFTVMTAIWLIVMQWVSAGLGGYVAGRLRTKWSNTHTHEVFFRDTAHGFITWAVATILVAAIVSSAAATAVMGGVHAAATVASGAAQAAGTAAAVQGASTGSATASGTQDGSTSPGSAMSPLSAVSTGIAPYNIDTLFRSPRADSSPNTADARAEAARILANGIATGDVPAADRTYLAELVAARTGISTAEAQKRVDASIAQAKAAEVKAREAADTARKAASAASIYTALSMLVGAFIACIAAALGGQRRDLQA